MLLKYLSIGFRGSQLAYVLLTVTKKKLSYYLIFNYYLDFAYSNINFEKLSDNEKLIIYNLKEVNISVEEVKKITKLKYPFQLVKNLIDAGIIYTFEKIKDKYIIFFVGNGKSRYLKTVSYTHLTLPTNREV